MRIVLGVAALALAAAAQTFSVASVKPSPRAVGKDYRRPITLGPGRVTSSNVSLKSLICDAYHVQPFQVTGPGWLDDDEFEIDAHADPAASKDQLRAMLVALLAERFHLAMHRDSKEMRIYALTVEKDGPKNLHAATGELRPTTSPQNFHGDMRQLANLISIGLSIPTVDDPTRPAIATGAPVPVVDKTGIDGNYDISVNLRPDNTFGDSFTRWQRALHDELGLKLETQRAPVEVLIIDRADRTPTAN